MFFALIFSTSRGAIFCAILVYSLSILFFWFKKRDKIQFNKILYGFGIFISFLVFLFIFIIPKESKDHFYHLFDFGRNSHLSVRMSYYKAASEIISQKPYFGVGPGNFLIFYPLNKKHKTLTDDPNTTLNHVHNDYLEIWVEYGIFALLLYIGIIVLFIRNSIFYFLKTDSISKQLLNLATVSAIMGYLLYSTFTVAGRYISSVFFLWAVIGVGYMSFRDKLPNVKTLTYKNILHNRPRIISIVGVVIFIIFSVMSKIAYCNYIANVNVHIASMSSLKGDYNRALIFLDKSVSFNKKVVDAFYQRGYVYYHLNNFDRAIENYEQVRKLAPNYVNIAFNTASCYYRKNDWVNAIKYASISNNHFPQYEPNKVMLAFCYYYVQQPLKALEYCNKILQNNPDNEKIRNLTRKLYIIVQNS
ncbi:MAG: O-antigen ligase family protein [Chitinispirillia bacterium]